MTEFRNCDVCSRESEVLVASSALGPISWAYCSECLNKPAEPDCMIAATVDGCCGLENVAPWARAIWTWRNGEYVTFDDAALAMSAGTAETSQKAQGDSPPARAEGNAQKGDDHD